MMIRIDQRANAMTASGQEPRKHHLVPRFYIDRWSENGLIRATDLDARKTFTTSAANAARETDFYRLEEGAFRGSPVWWEAFLSEIEERTAVTLRTLDEVQMTELDADSYSEFLWFLALQITRGAHFRRNLQWTMLQKYEIGFEQAGDDFIEKRVRESGADVTPESVGIARGQLEQMRANPEMLPIFNALKIRESARLAKEVVPILWTRRPVLYRTPARLVTSDEPVAPVAEDLGAKVGDFGMANAPVLVFPISPTRLLALFHPEFPILLPPDAQLTVNECLDLNQAILGNAYRFAFERPAMHLTEQLFVPPRPEGGTREVVQRMQSGKELHRFLPARRWRGSPHAPIRPVARWW
jgi:hypothetical protein